MNETLEESGGDGAPVRTRSTPEVPVKTKQNDKLILTLLLNSGLTISLKAGLMVSYPVKVPVVQVDKKKKGRFTDLGPKERRMIC